MTELDRYEQDMITRIDYQSMLTHTLEWSTINSGTRNLDGLGKLASRLAAEFSDLPGIVALRDPAPTEAVTATGKVESLIAGRHLVVRVRPDASRRILLTGHMDTVFAEDDAFQQCRWLDTDRLNGPGVLDMKSGLAIMLAGLKAFETISPDLGYDVLINSDEETGSLSSAVLIDELAVGKFAALTFEPSLPGGIMARARPGSGNLAAVIAGRAAHAGRNPEDGRNAVVAASDLALRLSNAQHPSLSINPAKIDGGGPTNVVPDNAVLRFNIRPRKEKNVAEATVVVANLSAQVASDHDVDIKLHGGIGRPPKMISPATERLFGLVKEAATALGEPLSWRDAGGVCDGNNIARQGVPVLDTMGAIGEFIHSPNEYLDVRSLVPRARLTALVLHRLAQCEQL
ncbi:glutamate carboxypeptidase [Novosphingobium sp. SG751A]|uniref:hydrolase n=1 Tax=Novosphingobium sp. SG751A TaxID=2587000 RepID=UPI00155714AD|nr:hydrolase [Novosphingobium sp. SG751A]NOW44946.1 glutamate carboxypeptidase [Novosphingobium sp. SG751A]